MEETISIYCKNNGIQKDFPIGISLMEILEDFNLKFPYQVAAAFVNYKLESLTTRLYKDRDVEFLDISSNAGMHAYVLSLIMIFQKAIEDIFPTASMRVEHPISKGYLCNITFNDGHAINEKEISLIKSRMQEIIDMDLPFVRQEKRTDLVVDIFRRRNLLSNINLLETLNEPYSQYYRLGNTICYFDSILLPSSSYVELFDIIPYFSGILLQIPDRNHPAKLSSVIPQKKLFDVFSNHVNWQEITNIKNISDVNALCKSNDNKIGTLIKAFEAFHEKRISGIADKIKEREDVRIVLISGPSSSGKTTFCKRLSIQLMVAGMRPVMVSTDDYFVERTETPLDENGKPDFECIQAMDLKLFNQQLSDLLAGKEVLMPEYNFIEGKKEFKKTTKMDSHSILVIEGIHALNPELTSGIDDKNKFKIYVSALTTISLNEHNWISTTDTRLMRRIIRDSKYRGYPAQKTIAQWPSVRKGEEKWIFPFQENADIMFNSAFPFEFSILKTLVIPALLEVPHNCEEYAEARRLLHFLRYVEVVNEKEVLPTSLLREFMGGSTFSE